MIIKVNTDVLQAEALEPQQYVFLYLQYIGDIPASWRISPCSPDYLRYLEVQNFIKITGTGEEPEIILRQRALNLFEEDAPQKKFEELWVTYPMKVPNGKGGTRPLRASTLDSKDAETCGTKYKKIIRNTPGLHEKIMQSLNLELEERAKSNTMQYMHLLEVWLNKRAWERYVEGEIEIGEGRDI